MDWRALAAVAAVVVVAGLAGLGGAVPNAQIAVSDVTVDPGDPTVNESVTITPTVSSAVGSGGPVEITSVTATVEGEQIGEKQELGTLLAGESLQVPIRTTFSEPGNYTVTIEVVGMDEDGEEVTATREQSVVVSRVPAVRLTVNDAAIQPTTPTAGAPLTVPVTVGSAAANDQTIDIDSVELLDGREQVATVRNLGPIFAGETLTVPLTTTFERPGEKQLTARLTGTNADDEPVVVTRPVQVVVEAGAPVIEAAEQTAVEGATSTVSMTVSNPTEGTLRNVVATLDADGAAVRVGRQVVPTLAPGAQTELTFRVQPETAGELLLRTNITYTTVADTEASIDRSTVLTVAPLEQDVSVRVETEIISQSQSDQNLDLGVGVDGILDGGNQQQNTVGRGTVGVVVSNLGNAPVQNVVVEPQVGNQSLGPRPVTDELAPGTQEMVMVSLTRTPPSEVVFEASYNVGANRSSTTATFDPAGSRGAVSVTGVDLETSGQEVEITGDIGNPGGSPVSGIVVSVAGSEEVSPVYPNRDFFVGEVDENAFAPFELTAEVTENATEIPLQVTYFVDGDKRTEQLTLPLERPVEPEPDNSTSPALLAGVVGLLLFLLSMIVLFVRQT